MLVVALEFQINRETDVPIREQVAAQIVLQIGSGALRPGDALPSVRALARRLGIHRNTVTQAYRDPVMAKLVVKRRGSQFVVRDPQSSKAEVGNELDEFVDSAIRAARKHGYSLQQLIEHLRDRLLAAPPDHILLVSDDGGMRVLMPAELSTRFSMPIHACSTGYLLADRDLLLGALLVSPPRSYPDARSHNSGRAARDSGNLLFRGGAPRNDSPPRASLLDCCSVDQRILS